MSVLYVAVPIAILMGATALWACIQSIRGGQFDDLEAPAVRMLIDDQPDPKREADRSQQSRSDDPQNDVSDQK